MDKWLYITCQIISYTLFALSIKLIFKVPKGIKITAGNWVIKILSPIFWFSSLYLLISHPATRSIYALVIALLALGIFLLTWRSVGRNTLTFIGIESKPDMIIKNSIYRYIRHPFYTSYLISYLSVFIVVFSWWHFLIFVVLLATYLLEARREEAKFLQCEDLKASYQEYMQNTGMFCPRLR